MEERNYDALLLFSKSPAHHLGLLLPALSALGSGQQHDFHSLNKQLTNHKPQVFSAHSSSVFTQQRQRIPCAFPANVPSSVLNLDLASL